MTLGYRARLPHLPLVCQGAGMQQHSTLKSCWSRSAHATRVARTSPAGSGVTARDAIRARLNARREQMGVARASDPN